MGFDITKLSEAELIELNRRIVERLQLMRSAKNLTQLARFSVGMVVEFDAEDGRTITGTVARLNQNRDGRHRGRSLASEPFAPADDAGGERFCSAGVTPGRDAAPPRVDVRGIVSANREAAEGASWLWASG